MDPAWASSDTAVGRWTAAPTLSLVLVAGAFAAVRLRFSAVPYFDDELGYFVRHALSVLDSSHSRVALLSGYAWHPPLLDLVAASAWKLFGYSLPLTRLLSLTGAVASLVLTALLGARLAGPAAGAGAALLLASTPPFFFHAASLVPEMLVTPLSLIAVSAAFRGWPLIGAVALGLAALSKPTAALIAPALFFYAAVDARERGLPTIAQIRASMAFVVVPIAFVSAWLIAQRFTVGVTVVSSDSGRFSDTQLGAVVDRVRTIRPLLVNVVIRTLQLSVFDYRWLITAGLAASALRLRRQLSAAMKTVDVDRGSARWAAVVAIPVLYLVTYSVVGREMLPRYLVPALPFFFIAGIAAVRGAAPKLAPVLVGIAAVAFAVSANAGVYRVGRFTMGAWNDHSQHADMALAYQSAFAFVEHQCADGLIVANYPAEAMAGDPRLGYVSHAHRVMAISPDSPPAASATKESGTVIVIGQQLAPLDHATLGALQGRRLSFGSGLNEVLVIDPSETACTR